jgi:hypothetical protein
MAVGSYGIVRPADVSPGDVEIFYHYTSNRTSTTPVTLKKLISTDVLTPVYHNSDTTGDASAPNAEILGGLYNLKLSADDFSELGIYTLHIRPKQIRTTITDCGVLASLPSVRGLVIDTSNVPPPKSYTAIILLSVSSKPIPYAKLAAVGSLMILNTSNPASLPASRVACRCASLKYAGTVITALFTGVLRICSALFFSSFKISADKSIGE